jgi:SAM-dependent methyltransferase
MLEEILKIQQHYQTKNSRGFMHPLSKISKAFIDFSKSHSPVIDMGCAYGNVTIAALNIGAKCVIACDMEMEHLKILEQEAGLNNADRLQLKQGIFPKEFDFAENSIGAIYASHILPFLSGDEVEQGFKKFYHWLKPEGKLFIVCYTVFIKELDNPIFNAAIVTLP